MKRGTLTVPAARDAANVIATEIDQHDVLRPFLLIRQEVTRQRVVLLRRSSSGSGSGDWVIGHGATLQSNEELRRGPYDLVVDEIQIEHVRRWIDRPQGTVDRERVDIGGDVDAL